MIYTYIRLILALQNLCSNWVNILLHRLFPGLPVPKLTAYKLRSGPEFSVRRNKASGAEILMLKEIWHDHDYAPPFIRIRPADIIVDIGANVGFFTVYAALLAFQGRVYSFEPFFEAFERLSDNVARNKLKNVSVFPRAVFSHSGSVSLFVSNENSGGHSLVPPSEATEAISVPALTLEQFVRQEQLTRIDLLKLDCEGSEYDILLTAPASVLRVCRSIVMEYHTNRAGHTPRELTAHLEQNGFLVDGPRGQYLYALNKRFIERSGGVET